MRSDAVVLHETKPATEWILGGPVQKVSPRFAHGALQGEFLLRLRTWAHGIGRVAPEWRFWLTPPGEKRRYLVPDVAYLSYARLSAAEREAAEEPEMAPDAAVEIVAPSDRLAYRTHKIDVYLRSGTSVVIEVDAGQRLVIAHDATGERIFTANDEFRHAALPGFVLPLRDLFAVLD